MTDSVAKKLWAGANAIMVALFVLSTVVQFNDPDAPRWIAVYAAAAVLSALETRRKAPVSAASALALIAFVWAYFISRGVHGVALGRLVEQWEMKDVHVEEAREMYGLCIVGLWMLAITAASWRRRRGARSPLEVRP